MRKPDELSRAIRTVAARVTGRGGVLIIRDGDDEDIDCPVELSQHMQPPADLVPAPIQIVIARPADPEARRGAKEQLRELMTESYRPTLHQAKFSALLDLQLAHDRSRSFRRLVSAVRQLTA